MQRLWEIILGLDQGFLGREGEFSLSFAPRWPLQDVVGAVTWNLLLGALALALVVYVYRREGRSRGARIALGTMRGLLLAFVIAMLNRPVLTLAQSREEPSVLAMVMDDSISMQVRDAGKEGMTRMGAVLELLGGADQKLIRELAQQHVVKFYRFDRDAQAIGSVSKGTFREEAKPSTQPSGGIGEVLAGIKPIGQTTQVLGSLRTVLEELQGQRLAGVVLLTDGRSTPSESLAEGLAAIKDFGAKIYPVAVGSDKPPQNILVESINLQDAAFVKDIVSVKANVRGVGYPAGHQVTVALKNKKTGQMLTRADGKPAQETITLTGEAAQEVELTFKPSEVGTLDVVVDAVKQDGEVDDEDNIRSAQVAILDAKIAVLYCEGYPRWDYRYLKNDLIRDATVDVSCLLFSADPGFAQEGDKPITRFPESMTEMLAYDVVLFGDVDPRQFTDAQLQLVNEFVARKGGGFGMVAGPRWSPWGYRSTPIEPILPVSLGRLGSEPSDGGGAGFRPALTKDGESSTIFRFFEKKQDNERFMKEGMELLFWYCGGVTAKPGVGEVYAEHPSDTGPDGRKAPLLVLGRYGAGRTLFSGIDDSWRWRRYTGESIFSNYWVQQLRYLARAKKLGQRRFTLTSLRPAYELGEKVEISLRVLDPDLLQQLPEQIGVVVENGDGQAVRTDTLQRREGQADLYVASWMADAVGRFVFKLPALSSGTEGTELPMEISVPRLELNEPQVNRELLSRLATTAGEDPGGPDLSKLWLNAETDPEAVRTELLKIPSAAMIVPVYANQPLWNAPLALVLFVLLITLEWVLRKVYGML
jgi:hypothetical protein